MRSFLVRLLKNRIIRRVRAMLYHNICFGCRARFGSLNPDRTFYVIRCPKFELGFWGLYNYVVGRLRDAVVMNAEPVIDWQYYSNDYLLEDKHIILNEETLRICDREYHRFEMDKFSVIIPMLRWPKFSCDCVGFT